MEPSSSNNEPIPVEPEHHENEKINVGQRRGRQGGGWHVSWQRELAEGAEDDAEISNEKLWRSQVTSSGWKQLLTG